MMTSALLPLVLLAALPAGAEINVPEGYTVSLAAEAPLVKHPALATFGPEGQLFVAETGGSNDKFDVLTKTLPGSIRALYDTDGDGRFDESKVFADKLSEPAGVLWHRGALYVAAPPGIWKLVDTDGDGVADERTNLLKDHTIKSKAGFHGPFLGPTGRLFWTTPQTSHEWRRPDGHVVSKGRRAMVLTSRTDGTDLHCYAGGGMANHVELAFSPEGDMFGTVPLLYRNPRRDAFIHWIYGGSYFSRRFVEHEFPYTGDLLGHVTDLGHVAPAGVMRSRSGQFGDSTYFLCEFNTQTLMKIDIKKQGSTFVGQAEPFVTATHKDIHFTDVVEDADGSLLIIDTGGWYVKGCPNSQIAKPNIEGSIWRIRRTDATTAEDPHGIRADYKNIALLDDARFMVRDRALDAFAARGDVASLRSAMKSPKSSERMRRNAVWALSRIANDDARVALVAALGDASPSVRQAAAHASGKLAEERAAAGLIKMLDDDPHSQRAAATALGRIGHPAAIAALLKQLEKPVDRMLEHALIHALIDIDAPGPTAASFAQNNLRVKRAALIALDQMKQGKLAASLVTPLLTHENKPLRDVAYRIAREQTDWADSIANSLAGFLTTPERVQMARETLLSTANIPAIQTLISSSLSAAQDSSASATRDALLEVIAASGVSNPPKSWTKHIATALDSKTPEAAIAAAESLRLKPFAAQLKAIGLDEDRPLSVRLSAALARLRIDPTLDAETFEFVVEEGESPVPSADSLLAVQVLGNAELTKEQLMELTELVIEVGPVEIPTLLTAFDKSEDAEVGRALIESLGESAGLRSINARNLALIFAKYPQEVRDEAQTLIKRVAEESNLDEERRVRLRSIITDKGDPVAGKKVFFGKGTCHLCHRVGDRGGQVGPDLSLIGQIRNRYDLIESIGLPNATFARGYESMMVTLKDGTTHIGRFGHRTEHYFELFNSQGRKLRFKHDDVFQVSESRQSVMPEGLDRLMTRDELNDLVAYLKSLK